MTVKAAQPPARQYHNNPRLTDVLQLLSDAGVTGVLASTITAAFLLPQSAYHRNVAVNNILRSLQNAGRVKKSEIREATESGGFSYRWFVTSAGVAYLRDAPCRDSAPLEGTADKHLAQMRENRHAVLRAAPALFNALPPGCVTARRSLIIKLRAYQITYREIGSVFGISGERVRQIAHGDCLMSCSCPRCSEAA